ncbi:hypothetical protein E4U54_006247 [Claviceps lovelessii]|nr:hypothetical protein E4U54_006247 [Claviceps lovelessii]
MGEPHVVKWLLDTRALWPGATTTKQLAGEASRPLALLAPHEQSSILKYHFVKDAKMALASALLKRHAITSSCAGRIPWSRALFTRDEHTKPVFRLPDGSEPLIFNVSHQAGLVCLLGVYAPPGDVSVGVDIACPSERRERDHALVAEDGWAKFVEMHDSVFSAAEAARLKRLSFGDGDAGGAGRGKGKEKGKGEGGADLDARLAYFYALWCLREAYVKMTGEALLAEWLGELEMRYFAPPGGEEEEEEEEEVVVVDGKAEKRRELEIWFRGDRVDDVDVRMEWSLGEYMICTAVRGNQHGGLDFGKEWTLLDMNQLLDAAEQASAR